MLDEFRVPTVVKKTANASDSNRTETSDVGDDTADRAPAAFGEFTNEFEADNNDAERETQAGLRAKNQKVRKAPDGAQASRSAKALERVPKIQILLVPEEINEKQMKGRAGRYYKNAQTLFVNGQYSVIERMAQDLERELAGACDSEIVRRIALKASRRFMAFRVGKATYYAISKRLAEDWNTDDLDKATSPETLSIAADDYKQSLSDAKKFAKNEILAETVRANRAA